MELTVFVHHLHEIPALKTTVDRAVAIIWFASRENPATALTVKELMGTLENAGYPKQNVTRLQQQLSADPRTAKASRNGFRLRPTARVELDKLLGPLFGPRPATDTDSIIPRVLVAGSRRDYLRKVVHQANASYDAELFDCCAVMLRRLIETLVIETFETAGLADRIRSAQGYFFMLNDLLAALNREQARFNIGRNSQRGLAELKELGDKSAHNRRFNATRSDIDRLRADVRTAVQELVHLAGLDASH